MHDRILRVGAPDAVMLVLFADDTQILVEKKHRSALRHRITARVYRARSQQLSLPVNCAGLRIL